MSRSATAFYGHVPGLFVCKRTLRNRQCFRVTYAELGFFSAWLIHDAISRPRASARTKWQYICSKYNLHTIVWMQYVYKLYRILRSTEYRTKQVQSEYKGQNIQSTEQGARTTCSGQASGLIRPSSGGSGSLALGAAAFYFTACNNYRPAE